jgi:hypothetical protein
MEAVAAKIISIVEGKAAPGNIVPFAARAVRKRTKPGAWSGTRGRPERISRAGAQHSLISANFEREIEPNLVLRDLKVLRWLYRRLMPLAERYQRPIL